MEFIKLYEFLKSGNLDRTTFLFVLFILLGSVVAKIYIGPPK